MNRLSLPVADRSPAQLAADRPRLQQGRAAGRRRGDLPYCLFTPVHYEPGYSYPLIVWLHHRGGQQQDLLDIMPRVSLRNYVAIAPRGLTLESGQAGWPSGAGSAEIEHRVLRSIEIAASHHSLAHRRVFLAGYQDGGSMALQLATLHPHRFAGAVSLAGGFPRCAARYGQLAAARHLPLMIAHGRDGRAYSEDDACRDLEFLHTANMALNVRQYPGGDELDQQMLADMNHWLMELING
jgi:phospholipase/carboxylesterase